MIAKPVHCLTESTGTFQWMCEAKAVFNKLQQPLYLQPPSWHTSILNGSSSWTLMLVIPALGLCCLSRTMEEEKAIAYGSYVLSKAERHYCVTRWELLAVVTFTRQYCPYLIGRHFFQRTNHGSLTWLSNFRELEGQLAQWLEGPEELDFDIVYWRGKKLWIPMQTCILSRILCSQCNRDSHNKRAPEC